MTDPVLTLYGIPNCDTVKKARVWLTEHGIAYQFHDYKKQGVPADKLSGWIAAAGWQVVLNRRGPTFRKLDDAVKDVVVDEASARDLMLAHPSAIKRPIIEGAGELLVGFDSTRYEALLLR
jgi:Spx/MgsR family transcriptional regulator